MKLNTKLFGNETWEGEPPLLISELDTWIQETLPQKKQDPGKFLIPCTIGTMSFEKAGAYGAGYYELSRILSLLRQCQLIQIT